MTPILTQLKEIAGKAPSEPLGISEVNAGLVVLWRQLPDEYRPTRIGVADCSLCAPLITPLPKEDQAAMALHIATFNPETAGKLLDVLEYAIQHLQAAPGPITEIVMSNIMTGLSTINLPTK